MLTTRLSPGRMPHRLAILLRTELWRRHPGIWTSPNSGASERARAELIARDPLLDAIVFSQGRFGVTVSGQPVLLVLDRTQPQRVMRAAGFSRDIVTAKISHDKAL